MRIGIALRPNVIPPKEITRLVKVIDQSSVTNVFIPESSHEYDSIELCASSLGVSKGLFIGSGVIRVLEHDEKQLVRRIQTLQNLSGNRFVLGVGTGRAGANPGSTIEMMLQKLQIIRQDFSKDDEIQFPKTYIAALKEGIARRVAGKTDGILLNFCSPEYAKQIINSYKQAFSGETDFGCYLKVFYSKSPQKAQTLLVEEFEKYSSISHYHQMFERDGVVPEIAGARKAISKGEQLPDSLLRISLVNPSASGLAEYVERFSSVGVTLPCVYPYFSKEDDYDFKVETIRSIISVVS